VSSDSTLLGPLPFDGRATAARDSEAQALRQKCDPALKPLRRELPKQPTPPEFRREVFSVEGVQVTIEAVRGWRCECVAFAARLECQHIEQAHRLRALRRATPTSI
jgi:hypothetical protein